MSRSSCTKDIPYEILTSGVTLAQSEKYIKENSDRVFHVPGGYKIKGMKLIGSDKIPVGVKGKDLIFQFIKPCFGLFVLKIADAQEEIDKLQKEFS
ncbi:MAG: hypothetical protein A4E24_00695 [Methanomethylovorans sp. PtaU1.Bin093]|jgi:hypothetical protein|uniref:DUF1894 domain-containing protein n=1 Tax=Methanomethylovorans sp. PtaU1.Bin093 TaxID=1811679 RepID=UPI0009C5870A|nr:DUF1894 domain-containing protein [Methanomethylovorans sp. PtaU1.Bin093]OPY21214.1 MAG: hypothetical protein A4E24_00695 [Methanomethylovorans sp. PtaU1.Bin093]